MYVLLFVICFLGFLNVAETTHFEIYSKTIGGACILLDVDATFNLSYSTGTRAEKAPLFNLTDATVDTGSSKCGNEVFGTTSVLSTRISPSGELLMFTFETQNGKVVMTVRFTLDAKKHFNNINVTIPIMFEDEKQLPLGSDTPNSYMCASEETVTFRRNNNFVMSMMIGNLHVQAYSIRNSQYGPAVECSQDFGPSTTPEPYSNMTTGPLQETTTKLNPETTTDPGKETTTTMTPSTPETQRSKYVVRDNEKVCIVLQGTMTFDIPFQKKDETTGTATVAVPDSVNVNGNCSYSNTAQEITLTFFNTQWMLDIVIAKETKSSLQNLVLIKSLSSGTSDYSWQAVSLTYVIDSHFPNAKDQGMRMKAAADGTFGKFKANTDGSYKCNAEQDLHFGKDKMITMELSKFQYRAFGNTNSMDFSGTGISVCAEDNNPNKNNNFQYWLIIILASVFGAVVVIASAFIIARYCKKKKNISGGLLGEDEDYAASTVNGSDEYLGRTTKTDENKQKKTCNSSKGPEQNPSHEVSGRRNRQSQTDSRRVHGKIFNVI